MEEMTPRRIVLASRNPKKVGELLDLLAPLGIRVVPVDEFPGVPEVEETGDTFEANAALKAEAVRDATGLPAVADDSGLCVDALSGAPGVRSARFAGPDAGDAENNRLLLERMRDVPDERRTARFVCVIALAVPENETRFFRGETAGTIAPHARGTNGFGYDPLFLSDELGRTFGETDAEIKHRVSHRGRALRAFLAFCRTHWPTDASR